MAGSIKLVEAPLWVRKLSGEMREAGKRGLLSAANRVVSYIQTEIIPREKRIPVDRGIYKGSWRAKPNEDGALVYNNAPHAVIIEEGVKAGNVKPGKAMIDALAKWVQRKGLTGAAKGAERAAESRRIAWAIAKSMQKNGIFDGGKGLKILEKAEKEIERFIEEEVRRELEDLGHFS